MQRPLAGGTTGGADRLPRLGSRDTMADAHQVELPRVDPSNEGKAATQHLWEAVHVGGISYNDDCRALEALCATVSTVGGP